MSMSPVNPVEFLYKETLRGMPLMDWLSTKGYGHTQSRKEQLFSQVTAALTFGKSFKG